MIDLNKLAAEIHSAAVEKGFWAIDDAESKHIAKMISELGEIIQADRAGVMYEIEHEGAKPEGVVAEMADFVMMLIDYIVYKGFWEKMEDLEYDTEVYTGDVPVYKLVVTLSSSINTLYKGLEHSTYTHLVAAEAIPGQYDMLIRSLAWSIIDRIKYWCLDYGFDLWEIIRYKMVYNESRPALHGRLY